MSTMHTHISIIATTVWCDTGGIKYYTWYCGDFTFGSNVVALLLLQQ